MALTNSSTERVEMRGAFLLHELGAKVGAKFSVKGNFYHLHNTQITGGRSRSEVGGTPLA
jgi:hypothetical protein